MHASRPFIFFVIFSFLAINLLLIAPSALANPSSPQPVNFVHYLNLNEIRNMLEPHISPRYEKESNVDCVWEVDPCHTSAFGVTLSSCDQCVDANYKVTLIKQGFNITGSRNSITVTLRTGVSVRVRGRGEIGKQFQETANGGLEVYFTFDFYTQNRGELFFKSRYDWNWYNTPKFNLFGFIPVTVTNEANKAVSDMLSQLDSQISSYQKIGDAMRRALGSR